MGTTAERVGFALRRSAVGAVNGSVIFAHAASVRPFLDALVRVRGPAQASGIAESFLQRHIHPVGASNPANGFLTPSAERSTP